MDGARLICRTKVCVCHRHGLTLVRLCAAVAQLEITPIRRRKRKTGRNESAAPGYGNVVARLELPAQKNVAGFIPEAGRAYFEQVYTRCDRPGFSFRSHAEVQAAARVGG